MTRQVVILTGYSRSGKSSLINHLVKEHNFNKISTSDYLTWKTLEYFNIPQTDENFNRVMRKDPLIDSKFPGDLNSRTAKIHVAEDIIVPQLGRKDGLVIPAIDTYLDLSSERTIICEVFNLEECNAWIDALIDVLGEVAFTYAACRRDSELTSVDGRQLIGTDIDNNGSLESTAFQLLDLVSKTQYLAK